MEGLFLIRTDGVTYCNYDFLCCFKDSTNIETQEKLKKRYNISEDDLLLLIDGDDINVTQKDGETMTFTLMLIEEF